MQRLTNEFRLADNFVASADLPRQRTGVDTNVKTSS